MKERKKMGGKQYSRERNSTNEIVCILVKYLGIFKGFLDFYRSLVLMIFFKGGVFFFILFYKEISIGNKNF